MVLRLIRGFFRAFLLAACISHGKGNDNCGCKSDGYEIENDDFFHNVWEPIIPYLRVGVNLNF